MRLTQGLGADFLVHIDLHETTDSDEAEFRPALAARDGKPHEPGLIPDGFNTVGDSENPQEAFQKAIVSGVEKATHIAPPDENGEIIGSEVTQHGPMNSTGLESQDGWSHPSGPRHHSVVISASLRSMQDDDPHAATRFIQ